MGLSSIKKTAIAVVDLYKFGRGGHFAFWHSWFAKEFASRFDQVLVISPDPSSLEAYFRSTFGTPERNISFHSLPRSLKKTFDLQRIRSLPVADSHTLHAFMMWASDLPPVRLRQTAFRQYIRKLANLITFRTPWFAPEIPWSALTSISWYMRGASHPAAETERALVDFLRTSKSCKAFMHFDGYIGSGLEKAHWVPDIENIELPPLPTPLSLRIQEHIRGHFSMGAFGIIAGYRCVEEILTLALAHPEIRFVLAGKVYEPTIRADQLAALQKQTLPNVLFVPGFIDGEKELNAAINATDATFIDGSRYPVQSGIVSKAIHFGKCIVTPDSNSWTSDLIREWGVGMSYKSAQDDFVGSWRQWLQDDGPSRSRKASIHLRSPSAVTKCFDAVSERLMNAGRRS